MGYKAGKTIEKTISPPLYILAISAAAGAIARKAGIDLEPETILEIVICIYGGFSGLVNFIKHRRK